jgi:protein-L-isoaspartate(D-aspartate) O-methyltransferase
MKRRARHFDGRTRMLWSPRTLWFGVRAILASVVLVTASAAQQEAADRRRMVDEIDAMLASAAGKLGVTKLSPQVRAAMSEVPRHEFVPPEYRSRAYRNTPLPIGHGQTISQPLIVALMTELLQLAKTDKVLEVGTGSGYQAAVLSVLAGEVYTIEIVPELGKMARANLERLGYSNVSTKIGDGFQGWAEHAPFDTIIVTAAPDRAPPPLIAQLKTGGRMVIPVGGFDQRLMVLAKQADGTATATIVAPVRFVPLIRE